MPRNPTIDFGAIVQLGPSCRGVSMGLLPPMLTPEIEKQQLATRRCNVWAK